MSHLDKKRYSADRDRHAHHLGRALFHGFIPRPRLERGEQSLSSSITLMMSLCFMVDYPLFGPIFR